MLCSFVMLQLLILDAHYQVLGCLFWWLLIGIFLHLRIEKVLTTESYNCKGFCLQRKGIGTIRQYTWHEPALLFTSNQLHLRYKPISHYYTPAGLLQSQKYSLPLQHDHNNDHASSLPRVFALISFHSHIHIKQGSKTWWWAVLALQLSPILKHTKSFLKIYISILI